MPSYRYMFLFVCMTFINHLGGFHKWRQHIFGLFDPLPPMSAFVRLWTLPLTKNVAANRNSPNAHFGSIKIMMGKIALLEDKFKSWVLLFLYLLRLQQNVLFCWRHHWSNLPSPNVRFCQHFTNPPSPFGCWHHLWKPP